MNDWVQLIISTIVAPSLAAIVAYIITRRKQGAETGKIAAETNGVKANAEKTYREMFYDEAQRRELISKECDEAQDALKQCVEENSQLRAEISILRNQIIAAGMRPLTATDTRPRRDRNMNDGAIGGGG